MEPLGIPDIHHLRAAQGWLELGNPREAEIELAKLSPAGQAHPDALEARWQVKAQRKQWEACCDIGRALTRVAPARPQSWIHLSFALHELRRTNEARDNLLRVADRFPTNVLLRYNLACYECQLNRPDEAMRWLRAALQLAEEPGDLKQMALADVDLQPLWGEIAALEVGAGD
ncbi:MAG: TPR end-of-group domain-containing protein [Limisphaerales bacterium]